MLETSPTQHLALVQNVADPLIQVLNTDVASAGLGGLRGLGQGALSLSGVSGAVSQALLLWQGPTNRTDPAANAAVTFNGSPITGTPIGFSSDNCWGFLNSQAYLADVTGLVPGDGTYTLADFVKPDADINGASLIVFFDDGNTANNVNVTLFAGNDSNVPNPFDADGWNVALAGVNYQGGAARLELHVSDGQTANEFAPFLDGAVIVNGTTLVPTGQIWEGNTVPGGSGPIGNGNLWDIRGFDITSFLVSGAQTVSVTSPVNTPETNDDCLSLVAALVVVPAVALNQPPVLTVPTAQTIPEGSLLSFSVFASDPDGDAVTLTVANVPPGATFNANTGTFVWTPRCGEEGEHIVTFTADDGRGGTVSADVTIAVRGLAPQQKVDQTMALISSLVGPGGLNAGQAKSLNQKLAKAKVALDAEDGKSASNHLQAFSAQVNSFVGEGVLSPTAAAALNDSLPSVVFWTGHGDGVSWNDARNWSGNKLGQGELPDECADVYIPARKNLTVEHSAGKVRIHSLHSGSAIDFTGGLTLAADSTIRAAFSMKGVLTQLSGTLHLLGGGDIAGRGNYFNVGHRNLASRWACRRIHDPE